MTESQSSDAVAWDTAEAGVSGLQETAMEEEEEDRESVQERGDEIKGEKVDEACIPCQCYSLYCIRYLWVRST